MKDLKNKKYKSVSRVMLIGRVIEAFWMIFIIQIPFLVDSFILYCFETHYRFNILIYLLYSMVLPYFLASFTLISWYLWAFKNTKKDDWIKLEEETKTTIVIFAYKTKFQKELFNEVKNEIEKLRPENNLNPLEVEDKLYDVPNLIFLLIFFGAIFLFVVEFSNY